MQTHSPTLIPDDPVAFVARAERATNTCDTEWPMTIYSPDIRLEMLGDGVRQIHEGTDAVGPALRQLYEWFAATHSAISKSLTATSHDTIVNQWEGTLFRGSKTTYGAEIWVFDERGHVVLNRLYTATNPKPITHPIAALRMLVGHPRPAVSYLATGLRRSIPRTRQARH